MSEQIAAEAIYRFNQASEMFRRSWSVYDRIVAGNVMRHREMEQHLRDIFRSQTGPFSLLDLGCGDSSMVAKALRGTRIASYTGVELVEATTRLADENLRDIVPQRSFIVGNLIDAVSPTRDEKHNLILASYALHHLSLAEKRTFFQNLPARLQPNGKFILVDIMTRPGENRLDFLARTHAYANRTWLDATEEERQEVRDHVNANDFPEDQPTYEQLARDAGLGNAQLVYLDPEQLFAMLTFSR